MLDISAEEENKHIPLIMRKVQNSANARDNLQQLIAQSEVLQPGFIKKTHIETAISLRSKKRAAKVRILFICER